MQEILICFQRKKKEKFDVVNELFCYRESKWIRNHSERERESGRAEIAREMESWRSSVSVVAIGSIDQEAPECCNDSSRAAEGKRK